jgi:hypothetical protein
VQQLASPQSEVSQPCCQPPSKHNIAFHLHKTPKSSRLGLVSLFDHYTEFALMKGMSIAGPQGVPGLPIQSVIQDFNTNGNDLFNQGKYREAIAEYSEALSLFPPRENEC